jgi:hypothetical protein
MANLIMALILILFAALSRLLPHPMNFAPITAIALFGGVYLSKKYSIIIILAALVLSDLFLGFYKGIEWVYGSFILVAFIGFWLRNRIENASAGKKIGYILASTLGGSIIFFLITNFGVWQAGFLYPRTWAGLIECFTLAIPFFRNALLGDLFYSVVLFGLYEFATRYVIKTNSVEKVKLK